MKDDRADMSGAGERANREDRKSAKIIRLPRPPERRMPAPPPIPTDDDPGPSAA